MSAEHRFFLTRSHDCSYLPDRVARTLFLDPEAPVDRATYGSLSRAGFRRSGGHLYRPHCEACSACIATRLPVADFEPTRGQRRVRKRNRDIDVQLEAPCWAGDYYRLFARYIEARHGDGDMYPASQQQFRAFLANDWSDTRFLTLRLNGRVVCVAVTDRMPDGLSAIYTFFDPDLAPRSLGVLSVLAQIEQCARDALPYLYLGYWIRDCRKMAYKTDYRPAELFVQGHWLRLERPR